MAVQALKKAAFPSFKANPAAYGCTGPITPSFDVNRTFRANQLKAFVPQSKKLVLPEQYEDGLIVPLERIEGLEIDDSARVAGVYPTYRDINPQTDIWVDRNYQRSLKASDLVKIERIGNSFDYEKVKALTCFVMSGNRLFATDGQKTALAAIHRGITKLPALVYDVPIKDRLSRQAHSFIGINAERSAIPATELLTALIISGEPDAVEFANTLKAYGIKPRERAATDHKRIEANETLSITLLQNLFHQVERPVFDAVCAIVSKAMFKPIRREHIWAARIVVEGLTPDALDSDRLDNAIKSIVDKHAILEAKENARKALKRTTVAAELASIYMKRYNKRAKALNAK